VPQHTQQCVLPPHEWFVSHGVATVEQQVVRHVLFSVLHHVSTMHTLIRSASPPHTPLTTAISISPTVRHRRQDSAFRAWTARPYSIGSPRRTHVQATARAYSMMAKRKFFRAAHLHHADPEERRQQHHSSNLLLRLPWRLCCGTPRRHGGSARALVEAVGMLIEIERDGGAVQKLSRG
jgi:hypothetical protein